MIQSVRTTVTPSLESSFPRKRKSRSGEVRRRGVLRQLTSVAWNARGR